MLLNFIKNKIIPRKLQFLFVNMNKITRIIKVSTTFPLWHKYKKKFRNLNLLPCCGLHTMAQKSKLEKNLVNSVS